MGIGWSCQGSRSPAGWGDVAAVIACLFNQRNLMSVDPHLPDEQRLSACDLRKNPENPPVLTIFCRNDRGTQWVTATMTPYVLTSTARSSWSSTVPPSPVTPDSSPIGNSMGPSG